ncbi:class I SAM-dependent methyltransferase [Alkaliphilus sp. MSJ-5]|uniref:Class I SAM-dependent methyltransferase n=1 Tax=Alkaliphilus flagellatus TaxID=2841507 RepID=A0ABS6G682_9FIRM|nr:class I SAM-dependent methyltransferase [Alkaliphilus flagellatus]
MSIDNRLEELEEAPNGPIKIVMDARHMLFTDNCFDNVTAFYSFMFMSKSDYPVVLSEVKRVLKNNGYLYLWEPEIKTANPFITDLEIDANGIKLSTTYGIVKEDAFQNADYFKKLIFKAGFRLVSERSSNLHFYQCWERI